MNAPAHMLYIRPCSYGLGVFANRTIPYGSTILRFTGPTRTASQINTHRAREPYALQVGLDTYIDLKAPARYVNHACTPNTGITKQLCLIALRTIMRNEEILYDYSTTMLERRWTMQCSCTTPHCRKLIEDFDLIPYTSQIKYIRLRIVMPFIVNHLTHLETEKIITSPYELRRQFIPRLRMKEETDGASTPSADLT